MKLDLDSFTSKIDLEGNYVDFSVLRTALTVERVVRDLETELTEANKDGECRGTCPKCRKARSFAVNVNTNRFNCFNKGCFLKGGGVIDLIGKLREIPAKEASHLLACAYGIQPYSQEEVVVEKKSESSEKIALEKPLVSTKQSVAKEETVSREEFEQLAERLERLSHLVWSMLFERGEVEETDEFFDAREDYEFETAKTV